ncbi:MAG: hypothetical protein ILP16_09355 [Spirochaetales bacterium]|nr:hypothetical protein [Spirochaetales bacterium]
MSKRIMVLVMALILCVVLAQGVFAEDNQYPSYYKPFRAENIDDGYTLWDALWFNPTIYCLDVLQFNQVYLMPDDPVTFFLEAAEQTDERIEEDYFIYGSFVEPEYVGRVSFALSCDVEEYAKVIGHVFDPSFSYYLSNVFTDLETVADIFPRGIGRANAYDTYRRTALQLAYYASKNGKTPAFDQINEYLDDAFAQFEKQFEEAMEAEAAATAGAEGTVAP